MHLLLYRPIVEHCRGEVDVPGMLLSGGRVNAGVEKVSNAAGPEYIGIDPLGYPGFGRALFEMIAYVFVPDSFPTDAEEEGLLTIFAAANAVRQVFLTCAFVNTSRRYLGVN